MPFPRSSGVLLHPTSFPSRYGIGDLGDSAYRFVEFLQRSGQQFWQVLPLGPTGHGNSPYMCFSSMAGNPFLISPDRLYHEGWLTDEDLAHLPDFAAERVDYDRAIATKLPLLLKAAQRFKEHASVEQRQEFDAFCANRAFWLNDYALFMALKEAQGGISWHLWDRAIASRDAAAMTEWRLKLSNEIFQQKYLQFEFFRQWSTLRAYANDLGVRVIGDIPIYVAHDSADVWAFPQFFHLDPETGAPALMAGVPPDYFSETGQLWGNPIYHWEALEKAGFDWWLQRFRSTLDYVDIVRIDHFRGFCAYWAVPQGEETAINGEWIEAPGTAFFETLEQELGTLPILAEDLGVITPDVEELRDRFEFPGMKILQFAFGGGADNPFLPFNFERNCVVYTGTHDNDTTQGWYSQAPDYERDRLMHYIGCTSEDGVHWDLIRLGMASVANQAIFPLQDLLGLGTDARMNFPGTPEGNWEWRYWADSLTEALGDRLRALVELYGRAPKPPSKQERESFHEHSEPHEPQEHHIHS